MELTKRIKEAFVPSSALIVYNLSNEIQGYTSQPDYYMETRLIRKDGTLAEGKPVSKKFISALVKYFKAENEVTPHGSIPENMLWADSRMGHERYVWWNPPRKRPMFFEKHIKMPDGDYNMPGIVYVAEGNNLRVFCFKGKKPQMKAPLLLGPFYNYYENGSVCLGSARKEWPKDITWQAILDHFETVFWASINSHSITNPMKPGYVLNNELKKAASEPFDTTTLRIACNSLGNLLQ